MLLFEVGFGGLVGCYEMIKLVIVVVNGVVMGGGFEIVFVCDLIIVFEMVCFVLLEFKVGLVVLVGGLYCLLC